LHELGIKITHYKTYRSCGLTCVIHARFNVAVSRPIRKYRSSPALSFSRARNSRAFTVFASAPTMAAISASESSSYSKRTSASRCSGGKLAMARYHFGQLIVEHLSHWLVPIRRLFVQSLDSGFARETVIALRRQIARRCINISAQRGARGIKPSRLLYQTQEAIVRHILGRFNRAQQAICEAKDRIAVTLVQDLESCCLSVCGLFQQPFICSRVRQSKRSILQEKLPTLYYV